MVIVELISLPASDKTQMKLPDRALSFLVPPPFVTVSLDQEQILVSSLNLAVIFANYFKTWRH